MNNSKKGTTPDIVIIWIVGILQLIFLALKTGGVVAWSWWIVMSPMIIQAAMLVALVVIFIAHILFERSYK